ncbi:hypothetical protein RBQ61_16405 [Sedimentibacter sp. MB35-C1]|uniref:hypothetical protein n=1 Tax=Sedimentibacter sp. MB35-C1 TaxID=3070995 RepID=UPI0027DFA9A0|nr:hypothetical protein [Sedimentibacter sp. MB35-C1]WMJ77134.1 hypothetical protein RBQ61_16405 [Sedimentibacter sp. MB35-C1]
MASYFHVCGGGFISYVDGGNISSGYINFENCKADVDISELSISVSTVDTIAKLGFGGFAATIYNAKLRDCSSTSDLQSENLAGVGGFCI